MKLAHKTALVTGGGSGIGLELPRHFRRRLPRRDCRPQRGKLRQAAAAYAGSTPLLSQPVDVADRTSVAKLFQWTANQLGPIDILVNAAGLNIVHRSLAETTPEEWDRSIAINTTGTFNCMQAVLPQMRSAAKG